MTAHLDIEVVIVRARSWLRPSVPYSQTARHRNEYGCYRTDCSGYVSMAWGLPPGRHGGLDTVGLRAVGVEVTKAELRRGDALIRADGARETRHAALFDEWADDAHTAYHGYEQAGPTGTIHRVIAFPYGTDPGYVLVRLARIDGIR